MVQETQDIVNNLYALRAGLSVVSEHKDKIASIVKNTFSQMASKSDELVSGRDKYILCEVLNIKCMDFNRDINPWNWYTDKDYKYMMNENKRRGISTVYYSTSSTDNLIIKKRDVTNLEYMTMAGCGARDIFPNPVDIYLEKGFKLEEHSYDHTVIGLPQMAECKKWIESLLNIDEASKEEISQKTKNKAIFYKWLLTDECERYLRAKADYFDKNREDKKCIMRSNEVLRRERERVREHALEVYKELLNGSAELKKQDNPNIKSDIETEVAQVRKAGILLSDEIENTFLPILDTRDWQYLDLIIYYLETGRADTMKEALQLVEREVQMQRIIGAIQTASERICKTIARAASMISSQLSVISSQLSTVISQQQVQIGQNQKLIAAVDMQNALIAKSNVTSERLAEDLSYIKDYGVRIK